MPSFDSTGIEVHYFHVRTEFSPPLRNRPGIATILLLQFDKEGPVNFAVLQIGHHVQNATWTMHKTRHAHVWNIAHLVCSSFKPPLARGVLSILRIMNVPGYKEAGRLKFQISPRKRYDGFTLSSAILSFPIRYQTLNEAVSFARFIGRDQGCEIRINDSKGNTIEEIKIDEHQNRWLNNVRLMRFATRGVSSRAVSQRHGKRTSSTCQYVALEMA